MPVSKTHGMGRVLMDSNITIKSSNSHVAGIMFVALAIVIASSGCSALNFSGSQSTDIPMQAETSSNGIYQVEMTGGFNRTSKFQGEIDGPLTVQTALERSGAIEKYRNMEIMVYRVVEETGRGLKMPVLYDRRKKMVPPEQDYAIHPNDRIVVQSSTNTALDKFVDSLNPAGNYDY